MGHNIMGRRAMGARQGPHTIHYARGISQQIKLIAPEYKIKHYYLEI